MLPINSLKIARINSSSKVSEAKQDSFHNSNPDVQSCPCNDRKINVLAVDDNVFNLLVLQTVFELEFKIEL